MAKEADIKPQRRELSHEQMTALLDEFGTYQRRLLVLVITFLIGDGYSTMSVVLIFAAPAHRCHVPGLANDTFSIQNNAHKMMVNRSIPMASVDGDVSYSKWDVYTDRDSQYSNRTLHEARQPCDSWVYDDTDFENTIVTQVSSIHIVGCSVCRGEILLRLFQNYQFIRFGRKKMFMIGNVLTIVGVIVLAFPVVTPLLLVYRFLVTTVGIATYMAIYVLCLEFMGPERRTLAGTLMFLLFVMGALTVGVLSYVIRDWRWLQVLNAVPFILCLSYWWLLDHSPRWLLIKGRVHGARKVILKVMKVNQIPVSADSPLGGDSLRMDDGPQRNTAAADLQTEATGIMADTDNEGGVETDQEGEVWTNKQHTHSIDRGRRVGVGKGGQTPQDSALKLLKFPKLIVRTGIIFFNCTTFYGLSLNVANLTGNIRTNFLLSGLVELVGYSIAWLLLDRLGWKSTHCAAMLLSGTSCLASIFSVMYGGSDLQWLTILLVMVGKLGISAAFNTIFLMSAELFPTVIRTQGIGWSSSVARLATALSPYFADLSLHIEGSMGRALPLVIFGALALAAGLLSRCLPETLHRKLPDTILEAATFTRIRSDDLLHIQKEDKRDIEKRDGLKYVEVSIRQI
ncbi:hypothetical protein ACOMHN_043118 [Nucella lapillus]